MHGQAWALIGSKQMIVQDYAGHVRIVHTNWVRVVRQQMVAVVRQLVVAGLEK